MVRLDLLKGQSCADGERFAKELVEGAGRQKPPGMAAFAVGLDSEGVFEALHASFQVLQLPLLLLHEEVLKLPEP